MSRPEPSRATLQSIIGAVAAIDWTARKRQEVVSAIRTVAKVIGRSPDLILADLRTLNAELARANPVSAGVKPRRWENARCLLGTALDAMSPGFIRGRSTVPMSDAWAFLFDQISVRKDRYCLSRLLRWLSANEVSPQSASLGDLERYRRAVTEKALLLNAEVKWDDALRAWNRCSGAIVGWPKVVVVRPSKVNTFSLSWSDFPPSLKADVDAWVERVSGKDLLAEGINRPLSPVTVKGRVHLLQAHASALVHRGVDPTTLTSIAVCLTLESYIEGLRFFQERLGPNSPSLHKKAFELRSIARHWCHADQQTLKRMGDIVRNLDQHQSGMTDKNWERLRQSMEQRSLHVILGLPRQIRTEITSGRHNEYRARVLAQIAVAIEILLVAPLRIKNLAALEIGRHLILLEDRVELYLPASEVKNRVDLHYELRDDLADLLRWYLAQRTGSDREGRYLFPGTGGAHKAVNTLRIQIMGVIGKRAGVTMNPHLFRHLMATLFLNAHPGQYEVARRVLGHKRLETTTRSYLGLESVAAHRHFDETISELRKAKTS